MKKLVNRLFILGVDGATWDLLLPLMNDGYLPGLAQALRTGSGGVLKSTYPPYSAPAWASFSTGVNPGKHGVFDFWKFREDRSVEPISSHSLYTSPMWDVLSAEGKNVAVINVPGTYPPRPINGVWISGMMTPTEDAMWAYPQQVKDELISMPGGYQVNPYSVAAQTKQFLKTVSYWVRQREKAHQTIIKQRNWDLFINVVQASDPVQHHFWNMLDINHPDYEEQRANDYRTLLLDVYQGIDFVIRSRLDQLNEDDALLIISDHGFGPAEQYFHVNYFLSQLNLLLFEKPTDKTVKSLIMREINLATLYRIIRKIDRWNLRGRLSNRLRQSLRREFDKTLSLPIAWSKTKAYAGKSTGEAIYINLVGKYPDGIVKPGKEYQQLRNLIKGALLDLRDATGRKVVEDVWFKEEMYAGPLLDEMPDIVFGISPHPFIPTDRLSVDKVFEPIPASVGGGRHRVDGVIIAIGKPFKQGDWVDRPVNIMDIAPTVYHLLGVPIPEDIDGKPLVDFFKDYFLEEHTLVYGGEIVGKGPATLAEEVYSDGDREKIEDNLRKLGYL